MKVKHVLMIAAVLLSLLALPASVCAGGSDIIYDVPETWVLIVPESITFENGLSGEVKIAGAIKQYSSVNISVVSHNQWFVKLSDGKDAVEYQMIVGEDVVDSGDIILTVPYNAPENERGVSATFTATGTPTIAGTHTDTLTFIASVSEPRLVTVSSSEEIRDTISSANTPIVIHMNDGEYDGLTQISIPTGKDVTLVGSENAVFTGQLKVSGKLTIEGITVKAPEADVEGEVSQYSKTAIALINSGDVYCNGVTFDMSGAVVDATAITAWWSTGDGANIVVENSVFNCAGQRPIRSDACVTVKGCTFNDPYRYAVQMTSKSSSMDAAAEAYVNFYNNVINAGTSSSKKVVYGIQLEGGYGCNDLTINGADNTINLGDTEKTGTMYYCDCGKVEHTTIVWNTESSPVHEVTTP